MLKLIPRYKQGNKSPDHDPNNPYHYHNNKGEKVAITSEDWEANVGKPYFKEIEDAVRAEQAAHPTPEYEVNPTFVRDLRSTYQHNMGNGYQNYRNFSSSLPQGYTFTDEGLIVDPQGNYYVQSGYKQSPRFTYSTDNPLQFTINKGKPIERNLIFYPVNMDKTVRVPKKVDKVLNIEEERNKAISDYIANNSIYSVPSWILGHGFQGNEHETYAEPKGSWEELKKDPNTGFLIGTVKSRDKRIIDELIANARKNRPDYKGSFDVKTYQPKRTDAELNAIISANPNVNVARLGVGKRGLEVQDSESNLKSINESKLLNNTFQIGGILKLIPKHQNGLHIVKSGDTFTGIAKKYGTTLQALEQLNPLIENIDRLSIGDTVYYLPLNKITQVKTVDGIKSTTNPADLTPVNMGKFNTIVNHNGELLKVDNKLLTNLDNYLISKNVGLPLRQAILYSVVQEGSTTGPHGNGAYGYLGWRGDRIPGKGVNLMLYLYDTVFGTFNANHWNDGGVGSGYKTGRAALQSFINAKTVQDALRALNYGYVRPDLSISKFRSANGASYFLSGGKLKLIKI